MRFAILATGSSANAYVIEHQGSYLLVDCGLSAKQLEIDLLELQVPLEKICGILISHEHRDHITGLSVFSRKFNIPVFATKPIQRLLGNVHSFGKFSTGGFAVENFNIKPMPVSHDALEPYSYTISSDNFKLAIVTDLGKVSLSITYGIEGADALILESNYDQELIKICSYSDRLKQRIQSTRGHISNEEAANLLATIWHPGLKQIVLAHISENSNSTILAQQCSEKVLNNTAPNWQEFTKLLAMPQRKRSEWFDLEWQNSLDFQAVNL